MRSAVRALCFSSMIPKGVGGSRGGASARKGLDGKVLIVGGLDIFLKDFGNRTRRWGRGIFLAMVSYYIYNIFEILVPPSLLYFIYLCRIPLPLLNN